MRNNLTPTLEKIPQEPKARPQWVVWREEIREGEKTKVPYQPRNLKRKASSTNPDTWGTFEQAASVARTNGFHGIGYVFSPQDDYAGVDLDKCRDPETGELRYCAQVLVSYLDSYCEASPSGTGTHIITKAKWPQNAGYKKAMPCGMKIEVYDVDRYFTMTGHHLEGTPLTIEPRQAELTTLHTEIFGKPQPPSKAPSQAPALELSDRELIEKAQQAANGEKFGRLWRGDTTGHPSPSEADLALCSMLAFWTGPDPARIDRLFKDSGLFRAKNGTGPRLGSPMAVRPLRKPCLTPQSFTRPPRARPGPRVKRLQVNRTNEGQPH